MAGHVVLPGGMFSTGPVRCPRKTEGSSAPREGETREAVFCGQRVMVRRAETPRSMVKSLARTGHSRRRATTAVDSGGKFSRKRAKGVKGERKRKGRRCSVTGRATRIGRVFAHTFACRDLGEGYPEEETAEEPDPPIRKHISKYCTCKTSNTWQPDVDRPARAARISTGRHWTLANVLNQENRCPVLPT